MTEKESGRHRGKGGGEGRKRKTLAMVWKWSGCPPMLKPGPGCGSVEVVEIERWTQKEGIRSLGASPLEEVDVRSFEKTVIK